MIAVLAGNHDAYRRFCRKYGISEKDALYIGASRPEPAYGIHLERVVYTCGYGHIPHNTAVEIQVRTKAGIQVEFLSCCHKPEPDRFIR